MASRPAGSLAAWVGTSALGIELLASVVGALVLARAANAAAG